MQVTGLEIDSRATNEGREFAATRGVPVSFIVGVGEGRRLQIVRLK